VFKPSNGKGFFGNQKLILNKNDDNSLPDETPLVAVRKPFRLKGKRLDYNRNEIVILYSNIFFDNLIKILHDFRLVR
jgi:hypothetical protein